MVDFKLDGLETPVSLPDEYLTVEQFEKITRHLSKSRLQDADFQDLGVLREITEVIIQGDASLKDLPMTRNNFAVLVQMYNHVGTMMSAASVYGDELVDGVIKKGQPDETPARTQKKRKTQAT